MDRSDQCEQLAKAAKVVENLQICFFFQKKVQSSKSIDLLQVRSNKAEEEVAELMKKSTQLESELDKTKEELVWSCN